MVPSSLPVDNAHEVPDLRDHAAYLWGIGQGRGPMELVELEPDQGLPLGRLAADRQARQQHRSASCVDQAASPVFIDGWLEGKRLMRPEKQGPPPDSFYELEIGILLVAIGAIVLVTLGGTLDLSVLF